MSSESGEVSTALKKAGFVFIGIACLSPFITTALALILGILFTIAFGNPFDKRLNKPSSLILKVAVVGLGFGIKMQEAWEVGKNGFVLTLLLVATVLLVGYMISRLLKLEVKLQYIISVGTAICGGSAIAAVAPTIKAHSTQISMAMASVFLFNAVALFVFPSIGHYFELSQNQFGVWSAMAIHDTSSVVGAAQAYGREALSVAVTSKLARTLWIIPIVFLSLFLFKGERSFKKFPWFILFFVAAVFIGQYLPGSFSSGISIIARRLMVLVLFLIGSSISIEGIKTIGFKAIAFTGLLWVATSVLSLIAVLAWLG